MSLFRKQIYLDNNATTPVSKIVQRKMNHVLKYFWGNPSSGYQKGKASMQIIEAARDSVAKAMKAHAHEIYFSSCATESNNAVLKTLSQHFHPHKCRIISSPIEHPSIINTLEYLKSTGIDVQYCDVNKEGFISIESISKLINDNTFLICCMLANNEIGSIQNVKAIAELAKSHNILVMSDCVQAFGKIPIDVKELGIDYATFSAHKIYGPKGAGALYARITAPLIPFIHGGHQEEEMRAETEATHNIAGFGTACTQLKKQLAQKNKLDELKFYFINELNRIKPDCIINSPKHKCLNNTINVTLTGIKSRELILMLDNYNIAISSGSACSTQLNQPSHVLKAIGLSNKQTEETIRISMSHSTTRSQIKRTIKRLDNYIQNV